jgi:ubiquinone/menaquinone biosynthesis C-methylase UbiE
MDGLNEKKNWTIDAIKNYYGRFLSTSADLQTSACGSAESLPAYLLEVVKDIHPEVKEKFYGCGSPFPPALEGRTVLDLGCGAGRDVYLLSKLVGPSGRVIGVDMTPEQLAVAEKHVTYHTEKYGYKKANVQFINGYIEDLNAAGIEDGSVDLVVSNCVTNLSPDKPTLFREIWRVLKPGGELYFSDVFADRRVPEPFTQDPVLLGECLGGAMYTEDFRRLMHRLGCADFRTVSRSPIQLNNSEIQNKVGMIGFSSVTFRAFKLDLEDRCEDFGQVAYYRGTIPHHPHSFTLDDHHTFHTGKPMLVCGNSADMISKTAYAEHFKIVGDKSIHMGLFDCGPAPVAGPTAAADCSTGACC